MRTDGVDVAPEAIAQTRQQIGKRFSARHVPQSPRIYKVKARNAQEAHEAIRPTDMARTPEMVARTVKPEQHFTEPPPRYSEASLVKKLEELGIGRPSTYASTLQVLRDREYVRMEQKRFVPEDKGRLVTAFLENFFEHYVEYEFTANLE